MSERTDKDYLAHIREAVKRTASYTEKTTYPEPSFLTSSSSFLFVYFTICAFLTITRHPE